MGCALRLKGGGPLQARGFDTVADYLANVTAYSVKGVYPIEAERAYDPADYNTEGVLLRTWHKKRDTNEPAFCLSVILQTQTPIANRVSNAARQVHRPSRKKAKVASTAEEPQQEPEQVCGSAPTRVGRLHLEPARSVSVAKRWLCNAVRR